MIKLGAITWDCFQILDGDSCRAISSFLCFSEFCTINIKCFYDHMEPYFQCTVSNNERYHVLEPSFLILILKISI